MTAIRWILSALAALAAVVALTLALRIDADKGAADETAYSDPLQKAIELRLEGSAKYADIALVIMAALSGLVLAGKDGTRIEIGDVPEWIMFICANLVLSGVVLAHHTLSHAITEALTTAVCENGTFKIANVNGPLLEWNDILQLRLLWLGLGAGCATLFSAHYLKK